MGEVLVWLAFGALAGWIASLVLGANGAFGLLVHVLIGMGGALAGGMTMRAIGAGANETNGISLVVAFTGAVFLLVVFRQVRQV